MNVRELPSSLGADTRLDIRAKRSSSINLFYSLEYKIWSKSTQRVTCYEIIYQRSRSWGLWSSGFSQWLAVLLVPEISKAGFIIWAWGVLFNRWRQYPCIHSKRRECMTLLLNVKTQTIRILIVKTAKNSNLGKSILSKYLELRKTPYKCNMEHKMSVTYNVCFKKFYSKLHVKGTLEKRAWTCVRFMYAYFLFVS